MRCTKCGSELKENAKFCFECGEKVISELKCKSCGDKLHSNSKFCDQCGAKVNNSQGSTIKSVEPVSIELITEGKREEDKLDVFITLQSFRELCKTNETYKDSLNEYRNELKKNGKRHGLYNAFVAILLGDTGMTRKPACKNMAIGQGMQKDIVKDKINELGLIKVFEKYKNDYSSTAIGLVEEEIISIANEIKDIVERFNEIVFENSVENDIDEDDIEFMKLIADLPEIDTKEEPEDIFKSIFEDEIDSSTPVIYSEESKEEYRMASHIIIPNGVKKIRGGDFYECSILESVDISDSVNEIEYSAFAQCIALKSVVIPDNVKIIESCTFEGCSSLHTVRIPDGVVKIKERAFKGCSSLISINIPNGVKKIEYATFEGCMSLESITIPDSVIEIDGSAFVGCNSLKEINCSKNTTAYKFFEQKGILPSTVTSCNNIEQECNDFVLDSDGEICFNPANIVKAEFLGGGIGGYWYGPQTECVEYKGYVYYLSVESHNGSIKRKKIEGGNSEVVVYLGEIINMINMNPVNKMVTFGISNDTIYFITENEYKYENEELKHMSSLASVSIYGGKIEILTSQPIITRQGPYSSFTEGYIYNPMVFKTYIIYFKDNGLERYNLKTKTIEKITKKVGHYINILGISDNELVTDKKVIDLKEASCKKIESVYKRTYKRGYCGEGISFVDCKRKIIYRNSHDTTWGFAKDANVVEEWNVGFNDDNRSCYKYFDGKTLLKIEQINENGMYDKGLIKFEKDGSSKVLYRGGEFEESRLNVCGNHIYFYHDKHLKRINMDGSGVTIIE
jgi:hypothetical protein